jgi:hypothetical protein
MSRHYTPRRGVDRKRNFRYLLTCCIFPAQMVYVCSPADKVGIPATAGDAPNLEMVFALTGYFIVLSCCLDGKNGSIRDHRIRDN